MSENYEFNGFEKYRGIRSNKKDVDFDGFSNKVYFNEIDRTVTIQVDDSYEYDEEEIKDEFEENLEENVVIAKPINAQEILDSGNDFLYRDVFHLSIRSKKVLPYKMNLFSDLNITYPVGEGVLDFCCADFSKELPHLNLMSTFLNQMNGEKRKVPEFHNSDEIFEFERYCMEYTMNILGNYPYQSVFSSVFPPYMQDPEPLSLRHYSTYISLIQQEMQRRIEFVFDDEFYPDELSRFKPHEKFAIYCDAYEIPRVFKRTEQFNLGVRMDSTTLQSCRLQMDEIVQRLTSHIAQKEKSPLECALGLEAGRVNLFYHVPHFMSVGYDCSTIHDMLELEFSKMLEHGIKLHKCKNCGRYFIVKGNYDAEYCDRVREGQTRNCQQIAAQKKYDNKLHNNETVALFRKYYKRYYARSKVGTIKQDKFRQWNYRACEMRDKCLNKKISAQEFEFWLESGFKNRGKK